MSKTSELGFMGTIVESPRVFRALCGRVIDNMPLLISGEGKVIDKDRKEVTKIVDIPREPITPKRLLHERIYCKNEQDRKLLRDHSFFTAMPVMDNPDGLGEVKLAHYSHPTMRDIINSLNPKDLKKVKSGALPISNDIYHAVPDADACIISPDVAEQFRHDAYSNEKERRRVWEYLAEGDTQLVNDTLKLVQDEKGGYFSNRMGIWLSDHKTGLRLLVVGSVGNLSSFAYGYYFIDGDDGRLVGVLAPEVLAEVRSAYEKIGGLYGTPGIVDVSSLDARVKLE